MMAAARSTADVTDLCDLDAVSLLGAYASGEISPVDVMRAVLERAHAVQPVLNPFVHIDDDAALAAARVSERAWRGGLPVRPLEGVPVSIKDTAMVKGWVLGRGSRLSIGQSPATEDAPACARIRASGALIWACTTTCEGGWKAVTDSPLTGITRNPHDPRVSPGGSSGGAGASMAAGCGPLALGSDGGGSIRVPASFSGVFGFKATYGRVPQWPMSIHYSDFSHYGPLTRSVADAALMLSVIEGYDARDPYSFPRAAPGAFMAGPLPLSGLRIGVTDDFGCLPVDPEVRAAFHAAVAIVEQAGAVICPVPAFADWRPDYRVLWQSRAWQALKAVPADRIDLVDPEFWAEARKGRDLGAQAIADAHAARVRYRQEAGVMFQNFDIVLSPAVSILPFEAGKTVPDSSWPDWLEWGGFAFLNNLTGQPAASLPIGFSATGLPIGMQVGGKSMDDVTVLRVCQTLQGLMPDACSVPSTLMAKLEHARN
ncbi:amidase family protein [Komagataeibacter swingsii]|uniref:amidase family protein n=1 Tax=Komagataeibacter swingsii TaxID=215220 RepID=UPI001FC9435A|nr:amidase family protein [Komagataeibacter swingsii]GBQ59978.1 amidase [Komagataeibacter swingsii DSM 16373]